MKKLIVIAATLACILALAGCAGRGSLASDFDDETGAYKVTADDAGKGSAVASLGGGIDVAQGQVLAVSPDLSKGSLQLMLLDRDNEVVIDEQESGRVLSTHELEAGDYSISVTCNEDGTTGTLLVVAVDAAEFERQNEDIEAVLATRK